MVCTICVQKIHDINLADYVSKASIFPTAHYLPYNSQVTMFMIKSFQIGINQYKQYGIFLSQQSSTQLNEQFCIYEVSQNI